MRMNVLWFVVGSLFVAGSALTAGELNSGPRVGASIPSPFGVLTVTHPEKPDAVGKKWDHVEQYGANPVVLIFARTSSDPLARLLKTIDAEVARYKADNKKVHALLVMLSDDEDREQKLKDFGEKHGVKHVSLAIAADGPPKWEIARDADVTVIVYSRRTVGANHTFRKDGLSEKARDAVIADLPKIVGK